MTVALKTLEAGAAFFDDLGKRYVVETEPDASGIVLARCPDEFGRLVHFTSGTLVTPEKVS